MQQIFKINYTITTQLRHNIINTCVVISKTLAVVTHDTTKHHPLNCTQNTTIYSLLSLFFLNIPLSLLFRFVTHPHSSVLLPLISLLLHSHFHHHSSLFSLPFFLLITQSLILNTFHLLTAQYYLNTSSISSIL
jgi:hypothetical protein